jgi:hypothetical protein
MCEKGMAQVSSRDDDEGVKELKEAESIAKEKKLGMWKDLDKQVPRFVDYTLEKNP